MVTNTFYRPTRPIQGNPIQTIQRFKKPKVMLWMGCPFQLSPKGSNVITVCLSLKKNKIKSVGWISYNETSLPQRSIGSLLNIKLTILEEIYD